MTKHPINVFFDASSLIKVGAPPGKDTFWRLVELVDYGFISVVTTDLTKAEIAKRHASNACRTLSPLAQAGFRQLAAKYFEIKLPDMSESEILARVRREMDHGVERMFSSLRARVLEVDQVKPSVIFEDYDRGIGLFVDKNKKNQFPDAFIFECLKQFASADTPLLIVADDPDFEEPAKGTDHISFVNSIEGLFDTLGLVQDEPDPDLELFLDEELRYNVEFLAHVERDDFEFEDYEASISCQTIQFESITAFKQVDENAPLLASVDVTIDLEVKIQHNDGLTEYENGTGRVSFFASITNDQNGSPRLFQSYGCSIAHWIGEI